ncbi:MAG: ferritin-like domain-containing protein [Anaerolineales bacterium]
MALKEALKQGMKLELDGRDFYREIAASVSPEAAEIFNRLADDEIDHYNYIKRQYEALEEGQGWSPISELDIVEEFDTVSVVFPPDLDKIEELPDDPSEEDALIFALGVEDKLFRLYTNSMERAEDPEAKQMFMQLASAEQGHFNTLMQRYESRFGYPR